MDEVKNCEFSEEATAAVAMELSIDQECRDHWLGVAKEVQREELSRAVNGTIAREVLIASVASTIRRTIEDWMPKEVQHTVFDYLVRSALRQVNWIELATDLVDDLTNEQLK